MAQSKIIVKIKIKLSAMKMAIIVTMIKDNNNDHGNCDNDDKENCDNKDDIYIEKMITNT